MDKQRAKKIYKRLQQFCPDAQCSLRFDNPLQLLIATILSAQCTDVRVNMVTPLLFAKYKTVADFAQVRREELEQVIQSTGFYRNKAKNIQECCQQLIERHAGEVPGDLDSLVALPGVGRKTANVVLGNGFGRSEGIVVDTHVLRLAQRIGLSSEKTPEKVEKDLISLFPRKNWVEISHLLIQLGRQICKARNPDHQHCPLIDLCLSARTEKGK
ncbi:MAG: endonuclease III [Thermoguttaceae bacterium]